MEKKTIFLELPAEMIDRIDRHNSLGDRSTFISDLLNRQLDDTISSMGISTELTTTMQEGEKPVDIPGEVKLVGGKGTQIGKFNINTVEGFEQLASKICEMSDDPIVRMRARRWK